MSELIRLDDIYMNFSKTGKILENEKIIQVLKRVDLTINEGEITVFVGESGCGKTTLGKIVVGLLKPSKGNVFYKGQNINNVLSSRKEFKSSVQFVQQDSYAALNPVRTIYQSLFAPIKNHNKKLSKNAIDSLIVEYLDLVGLKPAEQFLGKYPHQLSGGQRQRVCLARAVSLDPKLIVADEPVSMIDVSLRISILDIMKRLNSQMGISFIYITHDLATANYFATEGKMCVMYLGEIVEKGFVKDIINSPKHPYTKALISAIPIIDPNINQLDKEIPLKTMEIGDLINRHKGCSFYNRCLYAVDKCLEPVEYVEKGGVQILCCNLEGVEE
jgi:peptide/nickel transport system ATP-binding protein